MKKWLSILLLMAACTPKKASVTPATARADQPPPSAAAQPASSSSSAAASSSSQASSAHAAPASSSSPAAAAAGAKDARSLYDRLGGQPAITAVVDDFVLRNVTDPRVKFRFINTDAARLKTLLVEFVCVATGGPCKYTGRDMHDSHAGMDLVADEFNAVVENLVAALDKFHVGAREKGEILGALGPLQPQMVVPPDRFRPIDAQRLDAAATLARGLPAGLAKELLGAAIVAGRRGQRSYAEQLFSRAELLAGAPALAPVAATFREGAPPRLTTALKVLPNKGPQPAAVGSSDEDEPDKKPARGSVRGVVRVEGAPLGTTGVVMLEPMNGKWKRRAPKYRIIEQRERQFAPRIMAVPLGSTVAFPNFDGIYHNVFSLSHEQAFDLGLYRNGESREVTFDKEGIVRLACNLHASMAAHLIVVAAPHYAVVGPNGRFFFKSVAPGKYWMKSWSDRTAEPVKTAIVIKAGENDVNVDLKGDRAPENDDKFGVSRLAPPASRHAAR